MKPQLRLCVMMAVVAVIMATIILSALPDTAQAWSSNKVYVNLNVPNRYWWVYPPPNDIRIIAGGYYWRTWPPGWRWYRPSVQWEWSSYYPGHWWYRWGSWTIKKYGHRNTYYCQRAWACTAFRVPRRSMLYYRWDWTRNCWYYLRGGGWGIRWSSTPKIFLPEANTIPMFEDSVSTQDPDTLMASFVRIDSVQWANSPEPIPIDELTLTGTSGLSWTSPGLMHVIDRGDSVAFPEADVLDPPEIGGPTIVMKGRFQTAFDHPDSICHWTAFVVQFAEEPETPATSTWGIVFLAVGLLSVALILVLRRRRILART